MENVTSNSKIIMSLGGDEVDGIRLFNPWPMKVNNSEILMY